MKFNDLTKVMQPGMGRPVLTKSKVTSHCYELEAILPDVRPHWIISQIAGRISKKSELTHCVVELIFCFVNLWVIEISFKGSINDVCLWKQICKNKSFERDSKSVSGFFCRHQKAMYEAAVIDQKTMLFDKHCCIYQVKTRRYIQHTGLF